MIGLYRFFTVAAYALLYPYGRLRASSGNQVWRGRLGLIQPQGPVDVWIHAASVGEVKIVGHLVSFLKNVNPDLKVHVTTMTRQGFQTAVATLGGVVTASFFPLDASPSINQALNRLTPRMIVMAETEIWPNLILHASKRAIPLVLVNGRMSAGSFGKYKLVSGLLGNLLAKYDRLFVRTRDDLGRYAHFGVSPEKLIVAGDMKFDAPLLRKSQGRISELRARLGVGSDQFLFVAGSTRPGEERQILEVYSTVKAKHPHLRLAIAPRHIQRVGEIEALFRSMRIGYHTYGGRVSSDDVALVDRMGVLNDLYMAADLAFVGGTLVDIGGHNILEPVWARTPVLFGPYLGNVSEAAEYVVRQDYGAKVDSLDELATLLDSVIVGRKVFAEKKEADLDRSATAWAGNYILERLSNV